MWPGLLLRSIIHKHNSYFAFRTFPELMLHVLHLFDVFKQQGEPEQATKSFCCFFLTGIFYWKKQTIHCVPSCSTPRCSMWKPCFYLNNLCSWALAKKVLFWFYLCCAFFAFSDNLVSEASNYPILLWYKRKLPSDWRYFLESSLLRNRSPHFPRRPQKRPTHS